MSEGVAERDVRAGMRSLWSEDRVEVMVAEVRSKVLEEVRGVLSDLSMGTGNDGAEEYDKACRETCNEAARRLGITLDSNKETK